MAHGKSYWEQGFATQPQRAALDELGVVVGEAEPRARTRGAEHADGAPYGVGEDQECRSDGDEQDHPAHRGRARLLVMPLRAVLPDVLPELALPKELDEPRA